MSIDIIDKVTCLYDHRYYRQGVYNIYGVTREERYMNHPECVYTLFAPTLSLYSNRCTCV